MAAEKIRITLTNRPPVRIDPETWPCIAKGSWFRGEIEQQANRLWRIWVREATDGRRIVYGSYDTRWQGERGADAGELIDAGADVVAAINRVAKELACPQLAQEVIARLPPEEL